MAKNRIFVQFSSVQFKRSKKDFPFNPLVLSPNKYFILVLSGGPTCLGHYSGLPAVFELWLTYFHSCETFRPPSCITQMLAGRVIPACVPPPASFLSSSPWPIFISAPPPSHPHTSKSPASVSASLSLTCTGCCLCLPYLLTLHHWFGIEFSWRKNAATFLHGWTHKGDGSVLPVFVEKGLNVLSPRGFSFQEMF